MFDAEFGTRPLEQLMIRQLFIPAVIALLVICVNAVSEETSDSLADLDAFWNEVSGTVAEGDFEGYAATYHPDAILVSESKATNMASQ